MGNFDGIYAGVVVNNQDPLGQQRITIYVPQVLGTVESAWAEPTVPTNYTPSTSDTVLVLFIGGDPAKPTYIAHGLKELASVAGSKSTVYRQATDPGLTHTLVPSDVWFNTANFNKPSVWALSGGSYAWVSVQDNSIVAGQIAAGAIDGTVITGATIRTAATGQRISMLPPGGAYADDRLQMDSGGGEAKPSFLKTFPPATDTSITTLLYSADIGTDPNNRGASLRLSSGNNVDAYATTALLQAAEVDITATKNSGSTSAPGPIMLSGSDVSFNGNSLGRGSQSGGNWGAEITSNAIVNATTPAVPVPGLSCTVNIPAGRRVKVSFVGGAYSSVSGDRARAYINMGVGLTLGTVLQTLRSDNVDAAGSVYTLNGFGLLTTSVSQNYTFTIFVDRWSGTGNINVFATPTDPAILLVEDLGAV